MIKVTITDNDNDGTNGGTEREVTFRYRLLPMLNDPAAILDNLTKELNKHFKQVTNDFRYPE